MESFSVVNLLINGKKINPINVELKLDVEKFVMVLLKYIIGILLDPEYSEIPEYN